MQYHIVLPSGKLVSIQSSYPTITPPNPIYQYTVSDEAGRGAYGVVYYTKSDTEDAPDIVLKKTIDPMSDIGLKAAAKYGNIAVGAAWIESEKRYYTVMKREPGINLYSLTQSHLSKGLLFSQIQQYQMLIAILMELKYYNELTGTCHGDAKGPNIMCTGPDTKGFYQFRLVDFDNATENGKPGDSFCVMSGAFYFSEDRYKSTPALACAKQDIKSLVLHNILYMKIFSDIPEHTQLLSIDEFGNAISLLRNAKAVRDYVTTDSCQSELRSSFIRLLDTGKMFASVDQIRAYLVDSTEPYNRILGQLLLDVDLIEIAMQISSRPLSPWITQRFHIEKAFKLFTQRALVFMGHAEHQVSSNDILQRYAQIHELDASTMNLDSIVEHPAYALLSKRVLAYWARVIAHTMLLDAEIFTIVSNGSSDMALRLYRYHVEISEHISTEKLCIYNIFQKCAPLFFEQILGTMQRSTYEALYLSLRREVIIPLRKNRYLNRKMKVLLNQIDIPANVYSHKSISLLNILYDRLKKLSTITPLAIADQTSLPKTEKPTEQVVSAYQICFPETKEHTPQALKAVSTTPTTNKQSMCTYITSLVFGPTCMRGKKSNKATNPLPLKLKNS